MDQSTDSDHDSDTVEQRTTNANDWAATVRRKLKRQVHIFAPLVLIAGIVSVVGWYIGETVGFEAAFGNSEWFFQIVMAGALMAILRNEIGLRTYGLFAPVVIAFIMLSAGPFWGLLLFVNVLALTLFGHRALRPLKLGTAPRVAVLLSIAGIATAVVVAAGRAGELPNVYAGGEVFFPTIISAWYADRAASEIDERGWTDPAKRLLNTLIAVVISYLVISSDTLVDLFIRTPVLWGLTLLVVAYLGSRPGFRLSEYVRFGDHYDGQLGPISVAKTRVGHRLDTVFRRSARTLGRDVSPGEPSEADVLSMKRRNKYIETYNPPHLRPAADDKAQMNRRLTGLGIGSPRTYAVVEDGESLEAANRVLTDRSEFVIKPSQGYGGEGIVVVSGRDGDRYQTSKGTMTEQALLGHVRRIVDGHYSGLESGGKAILEEKLTPAQFMWDLHGDGVADIRIIVFQGFPVMAMTRLPTEESDGAANLHLGAVGVGLSLDDGRTIGAYQQSRDRELETHPDTGSRLLGCRIPNWDTVLTTAVEAAAASGLGYTGVDVVLTEGNVPKVLEVNIRPGLGIQNTTEAGIFKRLAFVEALPAEYEFLPTSRKIELARQWAASGFDRGRIPTVGDAGGERRDPQTVDPVGPAQPSGADGLDDGRPSDDGRPESRWPTILRTGGGVLGSGILLAGAWSVGFPVLFALFVLNATVFLGGLCLRACGVGGR